MDGESIDTPPGTPPATPPATPPGPPATPPAGPPTPGPQGQAPPPASKIVLEGTKTERELKLEADVKARETRISELEDQNHQLKRVIAPSPTPAPAQKQKKSWLAGSTFFED